MRSKDNTPLFKKPVYSIFFLIGLLAVFAIGANFGPKFTGKSTGSIEWLSCSDSDNGRTANVYGEATYVYNDVYNKVQTRRYLDKCYSSTRVQEAYCSGTKPARILLYCPSGSSCSNGACIPTPPSNTTNSTGSN